MFGVKRLGIFFRGAKIHPLGLSCWIPAGKGALRHYDPAMDAVPKIRATSPASRWLPTIVLVAAVAGVGLAASRARLLERYEQRQLVKEALKDPGSAEFGHAVPGTRGGATWCGSVNAKNSMGGYVGFQRYVAVLPRGTDFAQVTFERGDDGFAAKWRLFCEP